MTTTTPAVEPVAVRFELAEGIARIVLNRPEASNALDAAAARGLQVAVEAARSEAARCVVVTGAGQRFCVGGDLRTFIDSPDAAATLYANAVLAESALRALGDLAKPVVVGVQGAVAGAGLSFVLNADLVVATCSTKFAMAYATVGLTPDCGVSYLLPRAVGQRRALQMALLGTVITAPEAQDWGLVSEIVDDDELGPRVEQLGRELAAGPTTAFAAAKRLIRGSWTTDRPANALDEARTISAALDRDDAQRRIAAFLSRPR